MITLKMYGIKMQKYQLKKVKEKLEYLLYLPEISTDKKQN